MTELRRIMIEDMKLHGFSQRTQASYVATVRQLAKHYMRSPDQLSEEELRAFFLHLVQERKASPSMVRQYLCGIKFFYESTLRRDWPTLSLVQVAGEKAKRASCGPILPPGLHAAQRTPPPRASPPESPL